MSLKYCIVFLAILGLANTNPTTEMPDDEDPDHDKVPAFEWMENEGDGEVETLKIIYPDDSEDFALLEHYNPIPAEANETVDNCLFLGKLEFEDDVSVSLTGCPGIDTFKIVFASSKLNNHIFSVDEGVVTPLSHPDHDTAVDVGEEGDDMEERGFDTSMGFDTRSLDARRLPSSMTMNVYLIYDSQWYSRYRGNSVNQIRRIITLAQNVFYWRSLTTRIRINVVGYRRIFGNIEPRGSLNAVRNHARRISTNAHVYMYMSIYGGSGPNGIASTIGGVCSSDKARRASILDWSFNDAYTARVFAHECGHLLGMWHDFQQKPRGRTCRGQRGIMDYLRYHTRWTSCSVQDFQTYYNIVTRGSGGRFCLGGTTTTTPCKDFSGSWCQYYRWRGWCRTYSRVRNTLCRKTCGTCRA